MPKILEKLKEEFFAILPLQAQARLGGIRLLVRRLAGIRMLHTTETCTRTRGTVGRSMTTAVGIR
jgi:hypothetical protein